MHSGWQYVSTLPCRDCCQGNRSFHIKMLTVKPIKWFVNANTGIAPQNIQVFPPRYLARNSIHKGNKVNTPVIRHICKHLILVSSLLRKRFLKMWRTKKNPSPVANNYSNSHPFPHYSINDYSMTCQKMVKNGHHHRQQSVTAEKPETGFSAVCSKTD